MVDAGTAIKYVWFNTNMVRLGLYSNIVSTTVNFALDYPYYMATFDRAKKGAPAQRGRVYRGGQYR